MRGTETTKRIVTNFCTGVWVHDVSTSATFMTVAYGFWAWRGVKFWVSPLTRVVALTTVSHYDASA